MGRVYVCNGARLTCSMGSSVSMLVVLPNRKILLDGQPQANIMDHKPMVNIMPFGLCRSLANPTVAAATAAHHGVLTPMPCVPNTSMPWPNGEKKLLLKQFPALCQDCKLTCAWAGTISIVHCGQGMGQGAFPLTKEDIAGSEPVAPNQSLQPDEIVLKDAYWEKDGMKIRLLPHQKKVKLILVLGFKHHDNSNYDKKKAEFRLKVLIPGTVFPQYKEILVIKGSDLLKPTIELDKNGNYLYPIENFTSDLSEVKGSDLNEVG